MNNEINILALGLDKIHFQDKFEYYHRKYKNLKCLLSYNQIPSNLDISKIDRIDASLLYNREKVFKAFKMKSKSILDE